ncbi:MAG: PIN domain-containing protein [Acidobacteria bacterium]|nr:PIN domain-containing protein [Acidobacteriota bacterium]
MTVKAFVDTNVLVYAYDRAAGWKGDRARGLVEELWSEGSGILSTQVLQEFYVNIRRKIRPPLPQQEARALVADYLAWDPVVNDGTAVLDAVDVSERYRLSFWDALIVVAATRGGASVIYSEDLSHHQKLGTVQVLNPFAEATS